MSTKENESNDSLLDSLEEMAITVEQRDDEIQQLLASIAEKDDEIYNQSSLLEEKDIEIANLNDTVEAITETAEGYSIDFYGSLTTALGSLLNTHCKRIVEEAKYLPFEDRLSLYMDEVFELVFPDNLLTQGFAPTIHGTHLKSSEDYLYGAHLEALYDAIDLIESVDPEFLSSFKKHLLTECRPFTYSNLDLLILSRIIKNGVTSVWVDRLGTSPYTETLREKFCDLLDSGFAWVSLSFKTLPIASSIQGMLDISTHRKPSFKSNACRLYFVSLCMAEKFNSAYNLIHCAQQIDVLLEKDILDVPEINDFWNWVQKDDAKLVNLYPKVSEASLLRNTPLYRRINVLKLNGSIVSR